MAKNSSVLINVIANYGSKVWSFISIFIFIPFYIKLLGVEAYAVIGFYTLILGLISFADAGLSSAVTREFSKSADIHKKYSVLVIIERMYFGICVFIAATIFFLSPIIAAQWLSANAIATADLSYYIRLIGFGVVTQLLSTVFFGGLMGLNAQVHANLVQITWNLLKNGGVLLIFVVYKPTLEIFFIWQLICNILYVLTLRYLLLSNLNPQNISLKRVMQKLPVDVWRYIGGMTLVAILSAINIQADKIVTSSIFSLKQFGQYSIASVLAQLPVLLGTPLVVTIFPTLNLLVSNNDDEGLTRCIEKFSFLLSILVFPVSLSILFFAKSLILVWTGTSTFSPQELKEIVGIVRWLTAGSTFMALQLIPFYFLLAKGKTRYTIYQGIAQVIFVIPALYVSINTWGLTGAGIPWLVINFAAFLFLGYVVYSKELKFNVLSFIKNSIGIPLLVNITVFTLVYLLIPKLSPMNTMPLICVSCIIAVFLNFTRYNHFKGNNLLNIKSIFDQ